MQTETQVLATEIERVLTKVPTLFERDDTFYSTIDKKNVEVVSSKDMRCPLEIRPGGAFGHFDPDGGDLGLGDAPQFDKATLPVVYLRLALQWTKKAEWSTDDSRKAVINTFRHTMATSMAEFRRYVDAMCMTDGTGTLGTITTVTPSGGTDTVTLTTDGYGARLLRYGQSVNVYDATLATNRTLGAEKKLSYYDLPTNTIKYPSVAGSTTGDKIVVSGVSATPPVSIYGVPYHHNGATTGFWMGLDRSSTPEIRGNRVAAGGVLSFPFARLAMNKIGNRLGMDNIPKLAAWMHPCQAQAYEELGQLVSVINRQSSGGGALDLYFDDTMRMAGAPVKKHFSWDKTRIDFVAASAWGRGEIKPAGVYDVDGRRIFEARGASGGVATSQLYYLVVGMNIFLGNPVMGSYIDTLTVPTGY